MTNALTQVQVADESSHQSRLAHARGDSEAQGREIALKVLNSREFTFDRLQSLRCVAVFFEGDDLAHTGKNLQGISLRWTKAQAVADSVNGMLNAEC